MIMNKEVEEGEEVQAGVVEGVTLKNQEGIVHLIRVKLQVHVNVLCLQIYILF